MRQSQRQKDGANSHSGCHICYELPCKRAQDKAQLGLSELLGAHSIRRTRSSVEVSFEDTFKRQRFLDSSFTFSRQFENVSDLGVEVIVS